MKNTINRLYEEATGMRDKEELAKRKMTLDALKPSNAELDKMLREVEGEIEHYQSPETIRGEVKVYRKKAFMLIATVSIVEIILTLMLRLGSDGLDVQWMRVTIVTVLCTAIVLFAIVTACYEVDKEKEIREKLKDLEYAWRAIEIKKQEMPRR